MKKLHAVVAPSAPGVALDSGVLPAEPSDLVKPADKPQTLDVFAVGGGGSPVMAPSTADASGDPAARIRSQLQDRLKRPVGGADERLVGELQRLSPNVLSRFFTQLGRLRSKDADALVGALGIELWRGSGSFGPDPDQYVLAELKRHRDFVDPGRIALAGEPKSNVAVWSALTEAAQGLAQSDRGAFRDMGAAEILAGALEGLRRVEPDLQGEVLERMIDWPLRHRMSVLGGLFARRVPGEDAALEQVVAFLEHALKRPRLLLEFEAAVDFQASTRTAARWEPSDLRTVKLALAVLAKEHRGEGADGQKRVALELLAASSQPDQAIDRELKKQVAGGLARDVDRLTDRMIAELGLWRRGNEVPLPNTQHAAEMGHAVLVHVLSQAHAAGEIPPASQWSPSFAAVVEALRAGAKGNNPRIVGSLSRALKQEPDLLRVGQLAAFVEGLDLRGPELDEALREARARISHELANGSA